MEVFGKVKTLFDRLSRLRPIFQSFKDISMWSILLSAPTYLSTRWWKPQKCWDFRDHRNRLLEFCSFTMFSAIKKICACFLSISLKAEILFSPEWPEEASLTPVSSQRKRKRKSRAKTQAYLKLKFAGIATRLKYRSRLKQQGLNDFKVWGHNYFRQLTQKLHPPEILFSGWVPGFRPLHLHVKRRPKKWVRFEAQFICFPFINELAKDLLINLSKDLTPHWMKRRPVAECPCR